MIIYKENKRVNPFDMTNTGFSYYDSLLDDSPLSKGARYSTKEYFRFEKGLESHIEYMTADEYIDRCTKDIFKSTDAGQGIRNSPKVDRYAKAMLDGDKFPLPYLNYSKRAKTQEGRHRMLAAAKAFGENTEFPVLIVTDTDTTDEEILDYAKKKYPSNPQMVVDMVNRILGRVAIEDDEEIELHPTTISAIELDEGDVIEIDDQLYLVHKMKLNTANNITLDLSNLDYNEYNGKVSYILDDSDKVKWYSRDNNSELFNKYNL